MQNPLNRFKPFSFLLTIIFASLVVSCKDDESSPKQIDVDDPNAVSNSIEIENSTFIKGIPPSPSTSETAPVLYEETGSLISVQGTKLIVNSEVESGSAAGFYVQIDGADGYFKVTSNTATGRLGAKKQINPFHRAGRKSDEYNPSFSIEIPENIKPGEFCISYCVYDAQNQVSNIIERCIEVATLGGDNSTFLTKNEWDFVKSYSYEDGELEDSTIVGIPQIYEFDAYIPCGQEYVEVGASEEYESIYTYLTMSTNGGMLIESESRDKYVDYDASECEVVYGEETYTENIEGAWSYDADSQSLILIYNVDYDDEVETYVEQYDAYLEGEQLVLEWNDGFGYNGIVYLKPKTN